MAKKKKKSHISTAHRPPSQPAPAPAPITTQSGPVATAPVQTIRTTEPPATTQLKQSMAQKRAKHALQKISELENQGQAKYGLYVSYVKALPATIRLNGLGQAVAMEKAKGKLVGHEKLYAHVEHWLLTGWGTSSPWYGKPNIFTAITQGSQADYLRAHAEALAYLDWLKKFAVAMLVEDKKGGE